MEVVQLSSIQPGRRLARAVFNAEGQLLYPPGEAITQRHILTLEQCGIGSVAVESLPDKATDGVPSRPEDILETIRTAIGDRFRLHDMEDERSKAIFNLAVERQGRIVLSQGGKVSLGSKPTPAFQTQRPPKVDMQRLLDASHRMGTLPMVFHRLVEMINNPGVTATELAKVIAMDPALSARLLRLVNSPFYGMAFKVDTISRAVVMVGTRQLVMLAMGATLVTAFRGVPVSLVNMRSFWAHSISCGAAARVLARHAGLPEAESFFVAGLLHDIARLLIYTQLPNHSLYMLTEAKRRSASLHELELEALGFTHEELSGLLLRSWNCPGDLVQRVERHHNPLTEQSTREDVILPAANMLSQALGYGTSGEICIPPLNAFAWDILGVSAEQLMEVCVQLDESVRELRSFFSGA
jgi:Predicted signal transduction protein